MCCLFGVLNYSGKPQKGVDDLINALAQHATERGMDSTGVAYNKDGVLKIYKKPLSAWEMNFEGLENSVCITGHTRHATQGSETKNYNNHPFMGYCDNVKFALAHNGVLWNDKVLRTTYGITPNKVETDSYIAVQLLEHFGTLNSANIRAMCEALSGSFAFSMVDTADNLWLVRGDSPLSIVHLPEQRMYVYASTDNILFGALSETDFVSDIMAADFEKIKIASGEIMRISKYGSIVRDTFDFDDYSAWGYSWRDYGLASRHAVTTATTAASATVIPFDTGTVTDKMCDYDRRWLREIIAAARLVGYTEGDILDLIEQGFTLDDLEEWLYNDCGIVV